MVAMVKPDGEWNSMEVTCKGPLIKVVLNGKPVIDLNRRLERTSQKPGWFEKQVQDRTKKNFPRAVILDPSITGSLSGFVRLELTRCSAYSAERVIHKSMYFIVFTRSWLQDEKDQPVSYR